VEEGGIARILIFYHSLQAGSEIRRRRFVRLLIIVATLSTILALALGCAPTPPAGENPDDVVATPGGLAYRANVHQEGVANPWPSIQSTEVVLGDLPDVARVYYRDFIETKSGQTRNNIFHIYLPNVDINNLNLKTIRVSLNAIDLPTKMTATQTDEWHGADPARQSKTVLKIGISDQLKPGEYTFEVQIEIDGKDYGKVPCTMKVVQG
jgi:hypothetical protein